MPQLHEAEAPALRTLPDLTLHLSSFDCSSVFFIILLNKLVNISVFLTPVKFSRKLIELKEEVIRTFNLQMFGQKYR